MPSYATPQPGASLLLSLSSSCISSRQHRTLLILSPSRLSSLRAFAALEAGYRVVVGAAATDKWDEELAYRRDQGQVDTVDWDLAPDADEPAWSDWLDRLPSEIRRTCMLIVLSDTMASSGASAPPPPTRRTFASAQAFAQAAATRRYLVNIADAPSLSDFSWPVTHRFPLDSGNSSSATRTEKSPLQLALTTNSSACRLATRLRREVVAALPSNVGASVLAVSKLRTQLIAEATASGKAWAPAAAAAIEGGDDDDVELASTGLNRPVEQLTREKSEQLERAAAVVVGSEPSFSLCKSKLRQSAGDGDASPLTDSALSSATSSGVSSAAWTAAEMQRTRMRYVAQLSEYWPLDRLASVNLATLSGPSTPLASSPGSSSPALDGPHSQHSLLIAPPLDASKGRILLLGTGPGSTLLLTRLAYLFLTSPPGSPYYVDLFLSDKLVPSEILALIPAERRAGVVIAKKYPGNAEHAQDELMRLAVEGARLGKTVLRMKQGDPFLYGRGGEEVLHFRQAGYDPVVIPGLSSCLAGPTIAGIPVTQRGVAESLSVCTGVGRGGRDVQIDGYERGKTLCVLMGVARLDALVDSLIHHAKSPFPPYLPIALIERASSPDQRVVAATIETLSSVLKRLSPHRPPGMIVIGWGVMCLEGTDGRGDMTVLDETDLGEDRDRRRVHEWLGLDGYKCREGLGEGWRKVVDGLRD